MNYLLLIFIYFVIHTLYRNHKLEIENGELKEKLGK